jgi:hypothetical protein
VPLLDGESPVGHPRFSAVLRTVSEVLDVIRGTFVKAGTLNLGSTSEDTSCGLFTTNF